MKSKKVIIVFLCAVLLFATMFAIGSFGAADDTVGGLKITKQDDSVYDLVSAVTLDYAQDSYEAKKKLESVPETVEAWVLYPSSLEGAAAGPIIGNYNRQNSYGEAFINFEIYKNGNPRIWCADEYPYNYYDIVFENVTVPTDTWTHVTFVYDNESGVVSCYLNGELAEKKYFYPALIDSVTDFPFVLGGDQRTANSGYFKGELKDVAMFSDVRTSDEIKADYSGVSYTEDGLLCYYDVDESDVGCNIKDETGNGYDLTYSQSWLSEDEMAEIRKGYGDFEADYSFAVFGDTQRITEDYPNLLTGMYQWVLDNKDSKNIVYSLGLGDVTDDNGKTERYSKNDSGEWVRDDSGEYTEWDVAKEAISILNDKIPYSLVRGNHDIYSSLDAFNETFSDVECYTSQFEGEKGGKFTDTGAKDPITMATVSYANTWREFSVEVDGKQVNYILLNLDYGANDAVLAWASDVISKDKYADYKVIICTHGYLYADGTTLDTGDATPPSFQWLSANLNNGDDIWDEFVSKHANIEMVLSGHIDSNEVVVTRSNAYVDGAVNVVTEMLINPQSVDYRLCSGIVTMFYFDESENKVAVEHYSPSRDAYFMTVNQFVIDLDDPGVDKPEESWDGTRRIAPEGEGTEESPYLISTPSNLLWLAYQVINGSDDIAFAGKYFKQTCDLDLDGKAIQSIGYYFENHSNMRAFGGSYDGCGFAIKNGTITSSTDSSRTPVFTTSFGSGLFGAIYGAVIENVVLENVQIVGRGVSGAIVGIAAAPEVTVNDEFVSFNIISGCVVKDTVKIVALNDETDYAKSEAVDNILRAGRIGSICGMAKGTLIQGCTSAADIKLDGVHTLAGGIAGTAGLNTVIDKCAFTGMITLCDNTATSSSYFGGIVGAASPSDITTDVVGGSVDAHGDLTLTDCYSTGTYSYVGEGEASVTFGDIIGYSTLADGNVYTASNCLTEADAAIDASIESVKSAGAERIWTVGTGAPTTTANDGAKYLDASTGTYYSYTDGTWTTLFNLGIATSSLSTPYGNITEVYISSPMAVFKYLNGAWSFYKGYDSYKLMMDGLRGGCTDSTSSKALVYFRGDVTMDAYTTNLGWNIGHITFDLGGNTLYQATNAVFPAVAKYHSEYGEDPSVYGAPGNFLVTNGNIVLNTKGLFDVYAYGTVYNTYANNDDVYKVFNYTFSDVNVSLAENSSLTQLFGTIADNSTVGASGVQKMKLNVVFEDSCTFDISNATAKINLFNANDTSYDGLVSGKEYYSVNSVVNIEVGAVCVKAASKNFTWFTVNESNGSSVVFNGGSGAATATLTVPSSVTPVTSVNLVGSDGYAYDLEKISQDEESGTDTYGLVTSVTNTPYGTITDTYASVEDYPFALFTSTDSGLNWTFKAGYADFASAAGGSNARSSTDTSFVSVVYVRADAETALPSTNLNWTVGKIIIDLAGHTLSPKAEFLPACGKYHTNHNTPELYGLTSYYEIINGEIILNGYGLLKMYAYGTAYETYATSEAYRTMDFSFKNVRFTLADGAALTSITGTFYDDTNATLIGSVEGEENKCVGINIHYDDDCVFDISGAKNKVTIFDANDEKYTGSDTAGSYYPNCIVNIDFGAAKIIFGDASYEIYDVNGSNGSSVTSTSGVELGRKMLTFLQQKDSEGFSLVYSNDLLSETLSNLRAFLDGYDSTNAVLDSSEVGRTVWIAFRGNVTDDSDHSNTTQAVGNVIFDLNGYTLSQSTDGSTLFNAYAKFYKTYGDLYYTVKNGKIVLNDYGLFTIGAYGSGYVDESVNVGYYKTFSVTFDGVDFSFAEGATVTSLMGQYNEAANMTAGINGENPKNLLDVVFNNCTFDMTNAAEGIVLFDAKDNYTSGKPSEKNYYYTDSVVNIVVKGGSITGTAKEFTLYQAADNGSSVTFEMGDDGYTSLTLPNGVNVPGPVNNGALAFVKSTAGEETSKYVLASVSFGEYAPKMSITLANSFIMNVYVPVNYTQKFTFNAVTYENLSEYAGEIVTLEDGNEYYLITVSLGSSDAADELSLVSTVTVGESTGTATFTFSVPRYAEKLLNDDGATEVEKQLVKDVLAYIQSAYNYFAGHNTAEEIARVNALVNELLLIGGEYSGKPALDGTYSHNTALVKEVTLVLDAKPTIRFYVTDLNVEFYDAEDNLLNTVKNEDEKYVELDVYAYALSGEITYKLGEESGVYHISDYVYKTVADTDAENYDNLVNLVYCFVKYTESAADYRASVTGGNN